MFTGNVVLTATEKGPGVLAGNGGVLIGAVLAVASSFLGLYFKEWLENRMAKRYDARWLSNELVGRLEVARQDVRSGRSVSYQPWMEELYSKHFSALRKWETTPDAGEGLSQEVIQIEGLLRQYNLSLTRVTMDEALVRDLDERISRAQRRLSG
jgi:hypothetical protein